MDATNTAADRAANPADYQQFSLGDKLLVQLRNDLDRKEAAWLLRQIADKLEEITGGEG